MDIQEIKKPLPRMRSVVQAVKELKELDPNTSVTESYIRRLVKQGKIKSYDIGRNILINFDYLCDFLNDPEIGTQDDIAEDYGIIRRVAER